ncbi:diguanylate cyclase (GGDEF) domain-containing protein [Mariprofundus ferrinatatus]|uniref:Diguanylate cyclase (GGDEF) domain-containing protein n=1 Tax=Mariprofundus ferrinatatus TaxID=1921087 RepID=A0A2K8L3X9_9PROT|nr:GGDEF domain-containing protein [Mariprofundus ferrinatatus]ATX82030.1 diguanylate cyclase (GGDEF) domain-containing protein [Mariprofundus ferrinatatus]
MKYIRSEEELQKLSETIASVTNNAKTLEVLVFGGGIGGLSILDVLSGYDGVSVSTIVDKVENAPAFELARMLGVKTSTDFDTALEAFRGDIVIDVTGDPDLYKKLRDYTEPHHIELISAKSAKLLFDQANHLLKDEQTIQKQSSRLNLLDQMMDISLLLEERPPLSELTSKSFEGIHSHMNASKGLAIMIDKQGKIEFIGAIGSKKPECASHSCGFSACKNIGEACATLTWSDRYKELHPPIQLACTELDVSYNIILPVWQDQRLAGALLFDFQHALSRDQKTSLELASIHLNMTFKTLDHLHTLEEMAIFDGLTGVFNRRKFDMQLYHEVSRTKRTRNGTLSCGFIDLDNFKHINDTYGHQVGDQVLKHISDSIRESLRDYDTCARYGGDEFVMLIPSDNGIEGSGLEAIGMRILEKVSKLRLANHPKLRAGVSIGICTQSCETVDAEGILKQADEALYMAKKAGKGCMRIFADEQYHLTTDETAVKAIA